MNLSEAYKTLELSESATPEEAKKQYRTLTKTWHPDVNKSPDAEKKFKSINEAYECVKNGKGNDPPQYNHAQGHGWPFGRQQPQQVIQLENVELNVIIDFKESVLGCKKEIKYSRKSKCTNCDGTGEIQLDNGCSKCKGKGQTTFTQRGMTFVSTCNMCRGQSKTEDCKICKTKGMVNTDISIHVSIPAGIMNGNALRLQGMGNYAGSVMGFMDQYTDAFCHVAVNPDPFLHIEGKNVICPLVIDLLEAIKGCNKIVKTIHGDQEISIPPQSRNREEVIIPNCGVAGTGDQKVVLDVKYPEDTNKLINILEEN